MATKPMRCRQALDLLYARRPETRLFNTTSTTNGYQKALENEGFGTWDLDTIALALNLPGQVPVAARDEIDPEAPTVRVRTLYGPFSAENSYDEGRDTRRGLGRAITRVRNEIQHRMEPVIQTGHHSPLVPVQYKLAMMGLKALEAAVRAPSMQEVVSQRNALNDQIEMFVAVMHELDLSESELGAVRDLLSLFEAEEVEVLSETVTNG